MRLRAHHQHSQFWPILTRFVDYYSPFWGPEAISVVVEPKDALTCQSSTLAVLADSGPFCGILLTLLGPKGISTIDEPRGAFMCRLSTLTILPISGLSRGQLLTVLGPQSVFHD